MQRKDLLILTLLSLVLTGAMSQKLKQDDEFGSWDDDDSFDDDSTNFEFGDDDDTIDTSDDSTPTPDSQPAPSNPDQEKQQAEYINYVLACTRGTLEGFSQGFYSSPKFRISKQCLDKQFSDDIRLLNDMSNGFTDSNGLKIVSAVYQMMYTFDKYCNLKDIIYDVTEWCLSGNLSFEMVGQNLLSKVFVITGSVNSLIAEIYD